MFLTQKRLLFHQLSQTCGLARNPCRKPRGKGIRTKGNSIKDIVVEMVVKDGFSNIATVVGNKTSTKTDAPLSDTRAVYNLIGGGRVRIQKLSQGYARTKRWSSRTKYSEAQLSFLKWAFNLGAKDESKKLTPERAAEVMSLVGTEEGQKRYPNDPFMRVSSNGNPIFSISELVEKYEIKSFFSRTNSVAVKTMFKEA